MSLHERDPEFAPHEAIDLHDQNSMFLALEELGIAYMQDTWIRANEPTHKDAKAVHEQAEEFLADMKMILTTGADESRIVQNGWAGATLASHLRQAIAMELKAELETLGRTDALETLSDEDTVALALNCYLKDLELMTARDTHEKMMGRKIEPKEYIDFMIGWSGVFSGKKTTLDLPMGFLIYKGSQRR